MKRRSCSKRELQSLAGHLNHPCIRLCGQGEDFKVNIWFDLAVWETRPYDKVKCSIQGGSGMVAYIGRFLEWCVDDGERELVDTRGGNLE